MHADDLHCMCDQPHHMFVDDLAKEAAVHQLIEGASFNSLTHLVAVVCKVRWRQIAGRHHLLD